MSEADQQVEALVEEAPAAEECPPAEVVAEEEPKKAVKFETNELTYDEVQAEIDAIKAKAGEARESLRTVPAPKRSSYESSYSTSQLEDDTPKSKNMLSHLNTHSAMLNYKVQAARSLVRKQEDLLRNLARMRENMERSENEIGKASDYYSPIRYQPRSYFDKRAECDPVISRRQYQVQQVRATSPIFSTTSDVEMIEQKSERAYSPVVLPTASSHISVSSIPTTPLVSSSTYEPDEDFEREMAAIRKRVADISKQANEVTASKYSSYDYDSTLPSSYLRSGYNDIYSVPEPRVEQQSMPEAEVQ